MNVKRILCPVDFSRFNQTANEVASTIAKSLEARVIYLHACSPDSDSDDPQAANDQIKRLTQSLEQEVKPSEPGVPAAYAVEFGKPEERIVHYANENDIDLVVLGTHGRTGLRRIIMGSVAEAVVRQAECPVLAVKSDASMLIGLEEETTGRESNENF